MTAFAKDSSNLSYVSCKHFVVCAINLIHYMLNKFRTKFQDFFFFSYIITEKKISCGYFFFVKIYIGMSNVNFHNFQFNLKTINLWQHEVVLQTEVIKSPETFVRTQFFSVPGFIYLFMANAPRITSSRLHALTITFPRSLVTN